ncbi:MAG: YciI family protein, partial [Hyphomicrobiales bacterium]
MRFLMITYGDGGEPTPEQLENLGKLSQEGFQAGWLVDTGGITAAESAPKVRYANGQFTVTDGPFAESKEVIAGYAIVEVPS